MIDICATEGTYDSKVVDELGWIRREFNIADPLTKLDNSEMMKKFMKTGTIDYEVEQYVLRTPNDTEDFTRT